MGFWLAMNVTGYLLPGVVHFRRHCSGHDLKEPLRGQHDMKRKLRNCRRQHALKLWREKRPGRNEFPLRYTDCTAHDEATTVTTKQHYHFAPWANNSFTFYIACHIGCCTQRVLRSATIKLNPRDSQKDFRDLGLTVRWSKLKVQ